MLEPDEISSDAQPLFNQPPGPHDVLTSEEPEANPIQELTALAAADQPLGPHTK